MNPTVTINQDTDTPPRREVTPAGAVLTYLYDRSRDSKRGNTPGQDFIAYHCAEQYIAFAVCDGVSQSFYGDLAARFLGERLVNWLAALDPAMLESDFSTAVNQVLGEWTAEATQLVQAKKLSPALPPLIRDALARKRENGSESMFVAGRVDLAQQILVVCWMGDMRLWLWDRVGEPVELPGAIWETRERWSTRLGPKNGSARTAIMPLANIARLTIHTDGIGSRTADLHTITLGGLNQLAQELNATPGSDDVSVLDIMLEPVSKQAALPAPVLSIPDPREPVLRWMPVEDAGWYRLEITTASRQWTVDVPNTAYFVPPELNADLSSVYRVQALANGHLPGQWSQPLDVAAQRADTPPMGMAFPAPIPLPQLQEAEPLTPHWRPFRLAPALVGSLIVALTLSIGWYLLVFGQ